MYCICVKNICWVCTHVYVWASLYIYSYISYIYIIHITLCYCITQLMISNKHPGGCGSKLCGPNLDVSSAADVLPRLPIELLLHLLLTGDDSSPVIGGWSSDPVRFLWLPSKARALESGELAQSTFLSVLRTLVRSDMGNRDPRLSDDILTTRRSEKSP